MEPKFKLPGRPSKLDPFADKLTGWLRQEPANRVSRSARRGSCTLTLPCWVVTVPTRECLKSLKLLSFSVDWLGDLDSNQGCPGQSREFYR